MIRNPYKRKRIEEEIDEDKAKTSEEPQEQQKSASALVIAASDKAGMEGIDRQRIDAIILRESGDSLYIQQQKRRDAKVDERIEKLREKLSNAEPNWRHSIQDAIDREEPEILRKRPTRSTAVVVDMDMFYMACELLSHPELADKPACVGRGMILTSNYKARKYGVRSAMAGWIGDKLVHELSNGKEKLIHVPSNFALYREKSMLVRQALAEYDPNLRAYSLDEAYMDLGPYLAIKMTESLLSHSEITARLKEDPGNDGDGDSQEETWTRSQEILNRFSPQQVDDVAAKVLREMRQSVKERTGGLTCSAGLAPNFMLAKIASDRNKPNGQCLVAANQDAIVEFLYPLPIRKVSGIGRVTEKILQAFGISTVRQLYQERVLVRYLFHTATANFLLRASLGCSSSSEKSDESTSGQKGISRERTFQPDRSWTEINSRLEDIGRLLSSDMQRKNLKALTITVKVKLHTFDCLSKSRTVQQPIQDAGPLVELASILLKEIRHDFEGPTFSVRLLGIRCSNFWQDDGQASIKAFLTTGEKSPTTFTKKSPVKVVKRIDRQLKLDNFLGENNDEVEVVLCPLCQKEFPAHANVLLNRHVDACLSSLSSRKRSISDYFR